MTTMDGRRGAKNDVVEDKDVDDGNSERRNGDDDNSRSKGDDEDEWCSQLEGIQRLKGTKDITSIYTISKIEYL